MATTILMPQMGYDMREGTVVRWRKREGEAISRGEVIAEIETDKATVEMEAYSAGVLSRIVVEEGRTVPVGELIAVIIEPGESPPELDTLRPESSSQAQHAATLSPVGEVEAGPVPMAAPSAEVRASPIARRLAREKILDLAIIAGTGPGGRITEGDVLAHAERLKAVPAAPSPTAVEAEGGRVELSRMRQAIARVTAQSKREAPHFYVTSEIDMTQAVEDLQQLNESLQDDPRVSVNDMLVMAATKTLSAFPKFNGSFREDHLELHGDINMGIAIALEQGLIVPAIGGCQNKSLVEVAAASRDLIQRAQAGKLRADEYGGGSFSISNLGMFDVDSFAAIIYPTNAAVLAVGTVKQQPVVRDGQITIAQIMKATLSVDHRVADGAEAAGFLMELKRYLESPAGLLL